MDYRGTTAWSRFAYHAMVALYAVADALVKGLERGPDGFGIAPGFTVVDYGCGPGPGEGFLAEIRRFTKPGGILILEDGHQPRAATRAKVLRSGGWRIEAETRRHLRCRRA